MDHQSSKPKRLISCKNHHVKVLNVNKEINKEVIFIALKTKAQYLVVATEPTDVDEIKIHHILVRYDDKRHPDETLAVVRSVYGRHRSEYHGTSKFESSARTITRHDLNPLYSGIGAHILSFAANTKKWAEIAEDFDPLDPFVLNHVNNHKFLRGALEKAKKDRAVIKKIMPVKVLKKFNNWRDEVIEWFNDFAKKGHHHKKKQLYLYGLPGTGKTYFINTLFEPYLNQFYSPPPNSERFAWGEWSAELYNWVYIDEFNIKKFDPEIWKKAVAGEFFVSDVKYNSPKNMKICVPMVFISNYIYPNEPGVKERLKTILCVNENDSELCKEYNFQMYFRHETENETDNNKIREEILQIEKAVEKKNNEQETEGSNMSENSSDPFSMSPEAFQAYIEAQPILDLDFIISETL